MHSHGTVRIHSDYRCRISSAIFFVALDGTVATAFLPLSDVVENKEAKKEATALNESDIFGTPKPERLIQRIANCSSGVFRMSFSGDS